MVKQRKYTACGTKIHTAPSTIEELFYCMGDLSGLKIFKDFYLLATMREKALRSLRSKCPAKSSTGQCIGLEKRPHVAWTAKYICVTFGYLHRNHLSFIAGKIHYLALRQNALDASKADM
jgi:hypothetical protein